MAAARSSPSRASTSRAPARSSRTRQDFTIGLEEEFALVDPDSLELVHRFEELYAACHGGRAARRVGRRRADRHRDRDPLGARARASPRRSSCSASAARGCSRWPSGSGSALAATGTHPWANYLDQRIIDTEHYNRLREELRWVAQRNNTWSLHVHVGVRGADRAIAVCDHLRELLPPLLALSANSPFLDGQDTGLHSVRTEIFTRTFPRCGVHEPFGDWADVRRLHRPADRDRRGSSSRPSCGGACARTTPSARSSCGSATRRRAATRRSPSPA